MNTIGYDFGDSYVNFRGLSFALRVATDDNVYAPDPKLLRIDERDDSVRLDATGLSAAGGQIPCPGSLWFTLREYPDGRIGLSAGAFHPSEKCKSLIFFIRGIDVCSFCAESENMGEKAFTGKAGIEPISYPGRDCTMPLAFVKTSGTEWFVLSRDKEVRKKSFSSYHDYVYGEKVLVLAHEEDRRRIANAIELPEWQMGSGFSRPAIVRERCADLENILHVKPYSLRRHPFGLDDIRMVVNFHGEHWTGRVFNSFDEMGERLKWLCGCMNGRHILAFLPAWDGRYYVRYPEHEPSERMGGAAGLKRFVENAHSLGVKVVLMLGGPNLATFDFLNGHGMMDAALKTSWGLPIAQEWVDWDADLSRECRGMIVNFGHPGFRGYMLDSAGSLIEHYGIDGVFLDGAIRWENSPDYSPYEGIVAFADEFKKRHPECILMGEDGYDAIWGSFDLFATSWQPLGLEYSMLRYTRQSYYLSYPAENGSGGVHEQAWYSDTAKRAIPQYTIPTLSIVENVIEDHGEAIQGKIGDYAKWSLRLPDIAL
jgi:hypothetical protein